jgi:hypothetical protein
MVDPAKVDPVTGRMPNAGSAMDAWFGYDPQGRRRGAAEMEQTEWSTVRL